ncbi:MAG: hypothetical protein ACOYIR_00565 [Christensenellales bacterium]|jgi:hypothetical protein
MSNETFIGTGINPDGPDLPLGFGMHLAQDAKALETFGRMTNAQKSEVIGYIQGATTGDDAKRRIAEAVKFLHDGGFTPGFVVGRHGGET